jgi:hypothetical protein
LDEYLEEQCRNNEEQRHEVAVETADELSDSPAAFDGMMPIWS